MLPMIRSNAILLLTSFIVSEVHAQLVDEFNPPRANSCLLAVTNGYLPLFTASGLGVTIDEDKLKDSVVDW